MAWACRLARGVHGYMGHGVGVMTVGAYCIGRRECLGCVGSGERGEGAMLLDKSKGGGVLHRAGLVWGVWHECAHWPGDT